MNTQQQLQLEDAQERLSIFRKHLDLLAHCRGDSRNINANAVLSAVSELQSLVEWAAQQPELGAESAVLLIKLQELHQIKANLEKSPTETAECATSESTPENSAECSAELKYTEEPTIPDKSVNYSKDEEYILDVVTPILDDSNVEDLSCDKESLCDFSASTEDPNLANAESPTSIEDTNTDIIPNDDKTEDMWISDENEYPGPVNDSKDHRYTEENEQEHLEVQEFFPYSPQKIPELVSGNSELNSTNLYRSEVIIIETDEDNKIKERTGDFKNSNDPLDICMYAIRNLYESLRLKENELLKLSTMQNDQKHIEALQAVIIDFHKDKTNLANQLENTKRENLMLKEQVLELEEAENDARLEAQNLGQKLSFLQEKDSHTQAELSQLKHILKKNEDMVAEKEAEEKELRSEIKYMETLVQKYEDQIKVLEDKEIVSSKKILELELECAKEDFTNQENKISCNKGTQTYQPSLIKINSNGEIQTESDHGEKRLSISQSVQVPEESKGTEDILKSEDIDLSLQLTSVDQAIAPKEYGLINVECFSERELLNRLHKLIDEDVSLQQQIHNVDQINLHLWKKLQNLDNHIGECKRQNINETGPAVKEIEINDSSKSASDTEIQKVRDITTNENIPVGNSKCLDQNEMYIQERLKKLEEINASFENELKTRENICKEKEKKYVEWMETEKKFIEDLKRLGNEKNSLTNQITRVKKEKADLEICIVQQEEKLTTLKEINEAEITKIKAEEESLIEPFDLKVNQLLTKEKEILKMLATLKTEKSKNQDKSELEKLKCRYIELQLELSHYREQISKIEDQFRIRLDHCSGKYLQKETQLISELERLRKENTKCDKMISDLEMKQRDLLNDLEKQEKYLQVAKENYTKDLEEAEEVHRSGESELKTQFHQIEEGTVVATTVLMEERKKVEKELQENVNDLRAKEEAYKSRIAELEYNAIHLHGELHKMAVESKPKSDVMEFAKNNKKDMCDKEIETSQRKTVTENKKVPTESLIQTLDHSSILKLIQENIVEEPVWTRKDHKDRITAVENKVKDEIIDEDVHELRAQVRELQSQLEKISGAEYETPLIQPAKPVQPVKPCLGSQKLEDLDYAEVDDILDTWKKTPKNTYTKEITSNFQGVYGDKYLTGYKEQLKNEKKPAKKESVGENDYDEVLPRPTNFHVVQQVGSDTLLVGWNYVNPSILDGFEVYLGNQVHERIYIPDRTKALISGLNLKKPIHLSICALSRYGQMSEPTVLGLPSTQELNSKYFEDEDDEYRDFEDSANQKPRPYSMEW